MFWFYFSVQDFNLKKIESSFVLESMPTRSVVRCMYTWLGNNVKSMDYHYY